MLGVSEAGHTQMFVAGRAARAATVILATPHPPQVALGKEASIFSPHLVRLVYVAYRINLTCKVSHQRTPFKSRPSYNPTAASSRYLGESYTSRTC